MENVNVGLEFALFVIAILRPGLKPLSIDKGCCRKSPYRLMAAEPVHNISCIFNITALEMDANGTTGFAKIPLKDIHHFKMLMTTKRELLSFILGLRQPRAKTACQRIGGGEVGLGVVFYETEHGETRTPDSRTDEDPASGCCCRDSLLSFTHYHSGPPPNFSPGGL
jgi:hypothetical protein